MRTIKIALIGDYNEKIVAHQCIPLALQISGAKLNLDVQSTWIESDRLDSLSSISNFDGVWCTPGSPYKNKDAVLGIIQYVRENKISYLGTCGGYQHAILEYARNALNLPDVDTEEENPDAKILLISSLPCRLTHKTESINVSPNTKLFSIYEKIEIREEYQCGFGMNKKFINVFDQSALKFSSFNADDRPQSFEIENGNFFIGTAFQPERSAKTNSSHPLIENFINSTLRY